MNKILLKVLRAVLCALVGTLNFERVYELVTNAESSGLSGDEKRKMVVQEARNVGIAVGYALLNLAIEAAVTTFKSKNA